VKLCLADFKKNADYSMQDHFLAFLARNIDRSPQHLQRLDTDFLKNIRSLLKGLEVDLNASLAEGDD